MSDSDEQFREGLEGVVAAETTISHINGQQGRLIYSGYDIGDLAENASFEEVCFLLWNGRLPKRDELDELAGALEQAAPLPGAVIDLLRGISKKANPMAALRTVVSFMSQFDATADDLSEPALREKAILLTAQVPMIVASFGRLRRGEELLPSMQGMGLAERFLYQLKGEPPIDAAKRAMDVALILHAEHGFNASTFAARVTVSTLSDIYSAITSAIGTLKGPLHGGANERVIAMLQEIGEAEGAEAWIHKQLADKQRIFGFGHRVYRTMDPRAIVLKKMSEELCEAVGQSKLFDMSAKIEEAVRKEKGIDPNVDFYSASVYHAMGIPVDLFTPIFAISRVSGWTAHVMEQLRNNRLIRPLAEYKGPTELTFTPIDER